MTYNPIFQLSILSQNDQENPTCPGCAAGDKITASIVKYSGGEIYLDNPPAHYPRTKFPVNEAVLLPVPGHNPPPTPTWFMEVKQGIENAWFLVEVNTPGQLPVFIYIPGSDMAAWVNANKTKKQNQLYANGNCGIFGFAQENRPEGQPTSWIYTITAGVCNPKVNP